MKYTGLYLFLIISILLLAYDHMGRTLQENFYAEQEQCLDENNTVRALTKDEKKDIKEQKKAKTEKTAKKEVKKEVKKDAKKDGKKEVKNGGKKEVFLIYNKFNYLEAKEICKLYDGRLATEQDLDDAFGHGANWCTWGWLEGEMIGYPVQQKFWSTIEKKHKGYCGPTAGINKIKNIDPLKQYSVTCYGVKPPKTDRDKELEMVLDEISEENSLQSEIEKCKQSKRDADKKKWIESQQKNIRIVEFNQAQWAEKKQ